MEPFRIVIVGAGIGGLACAIALAKEGREITIIEKSRLLRETGAGISLQPNASRIVNKWGIAGDLAKNGAFSDRGFAIYTADGKLLNKIPFKREVDGADRVIYHRIDLHNALKAVATSGKYGPPATLRVGTTLAQCDCQAGRITLEDGETIEADLIIGADGIKSMMRDVVVGEHIEAKPTGLSAYRIMLEAADVRDIPELGEVMGLEEPYTTMIIAHDRRVLMSPCRNGEQLTVLGLVPDKHMHEDSSTTSWTSEGSLEDVLQSFEIFPAWVLELFKRASGIGLWQLRDIDPLPRWVKGKTIIVGDAAHAMLPLQGQGASQTFEDAEALQAVFADIEGRPTPGQVEAALKAVYDGRIERASLIQGYSRAQSWTNKPASDANAKPMLNPMEFHQYNMNYHGLKEWQERAVSTAA